eukprot:GHVL01003124.1.p1 GENE.GHVL01003124.1~~GHVL01003124.1.p1  ORF type:complete len:193 (+),score=31.21 GHVL01003124.1:157-735(+)
MKLILVLSAVVNFVAANWLDPRTSFCGNVTCYEVLDVPESAPVTAIKKSYRDLALKYHPDKNNGEPWATTKFREIAKAFEILSDTEKREAYDDFLNNPDSWYAAYRTIRKIYPEKTHPLPVLLGFLIFISVLQYINQKWHQTSTIRQVKSTTRFQKAVVEEIQNRRASSDAVAPKTSEKSKKKKKEIVKTMS